MDSGGSSSTYSLLIQNIKTHFKNKIRVKDLKKKIIIANEILSGVAEGISLTELQCLHENTKKKNSKQGRMNILCGEHQRPFFSKGPILYP